MLRLLLLSVLLSGCSHINKTSNSCDRLDRCIELASALTGKSYLYEERELNASTKIQSAGQLQWTKENADFMLGELLNSQGYARLALKDKNSYRLINARDIRYATMPSYNATKTSNDELPPTNSSDYVQIVYQSAHGPHRIAEIARNLRPFMSRYGRVIDVNTGLIIIADNLTNGERLLGMIRKMDVAVSKEEQRNIDRSYDLEMMREKTRQEVKAKLDEILVNIKKKD